MADEQFSMVEALSEELGQKEERIMALEQEVQTANTKLKKFMKDTLIKSISGSDDFVDDGFDIMPDDRQIWLELILDMNKNNWNEDDNFCELYINGNTILSRFRECCECDKCEGVSLILRPDGYDYICSDCKCCNPECYEAFEGYGNNPAPMKWGEGVCCDDCNMLVVDIRAFRRTRGLD